MSLMHEGELNVRIMEVSGDKDSDAMAAAFNHVVTKGGCDVSYDYILQGPTYACRLHCENTRWAIISFEENEGSQPAKVAEPEPELTEEEKAVIAANAETAQKVDNGFKALEEKAAPGRVIDEVKDLTAVSLSADGGEPIKADKDSIIYNEPGK